MPLFPLPKAVLERAHGTFAETPFPLLLHALFVEDRTCCLQFKQHALEKKVFFEEGVPVACTSNLAHETLGRFLVDEGKLTEAQYQEALSGSAAAGRKMSEWLTEKGTVTAYDLFRMMQKNLAFKILDCFAWTNGTWKILPDETEAETPLKMNPAQLVLTGCATSAPYDVIAAGLVFFDEQRFALVPKPPHDLKALKLSGKEQKLLAVLRERPTFGELSGKVQLSTDEAMRRLYSLTLLGFVAFADEVDAVASAAPPVAIESAPQPAVVAAPGRSPEQVKNEVMELFLKHRSLDAFELFGLKEDHTFAQLKAVWLAYAEKYAPWPLQGEAYGGIAEKAEALFLAGARAYAELVDPERKNAVLKRRRMAEEAKQRKRQTDFTIQTNLLDAGAQFESGRKLLAAGNLTPAIQHLEYAVEIEPRRALYRAWLGWARWIQSPEHGHVAALADLAAATKQDPMLPDAFFFEGQIRKARGDLPAAETALRRAVKLAPARADIAEALKQLAAAPRR